MKAPYVQQSNMFGNCNHFSGQLANIAKEVLFMLQDLNLASLRGLSRCFSEYALIIWMALKYKE